MRAAGVLGARAALLRRRAASVARAAVQQPQAVPILDAGGAQRFTVRIPYSVDPSSRQRLDAFLAAALPAGTSRARVAAAIRDGALTCNGRAVTKPSASVQPGDELQLCLSPPPAMEACPEDLPLDIVYEDDALLVVNKAAHMVVHPSAGHASGTLVNAVLHHCALPPMRVPSGARPRSALMEEEDEREADDDGDDGEGDDDEAGCSPLAVWPAGTQPPVMRPGIVHRLDKGTSGLLVVAKTASSHARLCAQFAERSVTRLYQSLHVGTPVERSGRVDAPVGRHPTARLRMAVVWAPAGSRPAASRFEVVERFACGGACEMAWRLESGRTHQVRVHAAHIGHPLVCDPLYGGTARALAAALLRSSRNDLGGGGARSSSAAEAAAAQADAAAGGRPCLHAAVLGFDHPDGAKGRMEFRVDAPRDFQAARAALRAIG